MTIMWVSHANQVMSCGPVTWHHMKSCGVLWCHMCVTWPCDMGPHDSHVMSTWCHVMAMWCHMTATWCHMTATWCHMTATWCHIMAMWGARDITWHHMMPMWLAMWLACDITWWARDQHVMSCACNMTPMWHLLLCHVQPTWQCQLSPAVPNIIWAWAAVNSLLWLDFWPRLCTADLLSILIVWEHPSFTHCLLTNLQPGRLTYCFTVVSFKERVIWILEHLSPMGKIYYNLSLKYNIKSHIE